MARLLDHFFMSITRLLLKVGAFGFWSLIYSYCGIYTSFMLFKLLWSIITKRSKTFQWIIRENPPACLNDMSLGTHCYVRIKESGLRFHYVAAGERGKPLMLLLHGFPEFWYSWRHQLREFKSEYRVVAVDLRGYGESDAPTGRENYNLDYSITDIKDIVESLGYSKCVLIGHDWGGLIAWMIAVYYPEMVAKLVILNFPHPTVFTEYILQHPSQFIKSSYYFFFQVPWVPEFMFTINDFKSLKYLFTSHTTGIGRRGCRLTKEDIDAYLYVFSQSGALTGPINHYRNIFSCLPLKKHEVTSPTLLLWGEKDAFLELDMAEITKRHVKNHFRLSIVSGASHWLQQDQPDVVNKLIWTFLKDGETRKIF
ncbi:epoxide hydrolase 4 [Latimeria chalumnae]|uniref:Epoxide hydrolase 4 n=1 Tax=Latimeria chalumnae TaxID=7897 RepID=H2ZVN0_LATCH|nr:PREDICTED: epoxide hydrolase 4 [Latimeria chalumnae]|eukprot:XP_006001130.1 PREDICTED: epoxide hydrolase 4 [Latimeria chalumnae]